MNLGLKDKVAIITGSARGLGEAIASTLASQEANIVVTDINGDAAKTTAAKIAETHGVQVLALEHDVSSEESTTKVVEVVMEKFARIDILVNNAGITRDTLLIRMDQTDWDQVIQTNLTGAFICTKLVAKHMIKQRSGNIVNISSVVGLMGNVGQANYCAAKAGLIGLTKTTAKELAKRGICVNAIAPGFIESDMTAVLSDEIKKIMLGQIPLGSYGQPDDVA